MTLTVDYERATCDAELAWLRCVLVAASRCGHFRLASHGRKRWGRWWVSRSISWATEGLIPRAIATSSATRYCCRWGRPRRWRGL